MLPQLREHQWEVVNVREEGAMNWHLHALLTAAAEATAEAQANLAAEASVLVVLVL